MLRFFDTFQRKLLRELLLVRCRIVDDLMTRLRQRFARIAAGAGVALLVHRRSGRQRVPVQFVPRAFEIRGGVAVSDAADAGELMRPALDVGRANRTGLTAIQ